MESASATHARRTRIPNPQSPIPNPESPIPNPQSRIPNLEPRAAGIIDLMNARISRQLLPISTFALAAVLCAAPAAAQLSENIQDILRRIHTTQEFGAAGRGAGAGGRWVDDGAGYAAVERTSGGASELVRYDTATGRRDVLMTAAQLTPPALGKPLQVGDYARSADGRRMLFATSGRQTMIRKTAYDYWTLDKTSGEWRKLGGGVEGGLLYAKLSPDGSRAAYVRGNNLFVEDLRTGATTALTSDGSPMIINGTSDWVYEEELGLRDAFEWSPDGRRIAYYQFDQTGVPEFTLVNYTDALYPSITRYPYPKAGQTNASVRIGVVEAAGGPTRWMKVPGDPRNTYVARMDWAASADELVLQHLNRLQNTNTFLLANAATGEVKTMFVDHDAAWVDYNETFRWIEQGRRLLVESKRDGWRHAYAVSRDGDARLITTGAFDILSIAGIDEAGGWLYYIASPANATQRYLYRSRLDGSGQAQRVTPAAASGTHTYNLSPDCRWAFHSDSRFDLPGQSDLDSPARPRRRPRLLRQRGAQGEGGPHARRPHRDAAGGPRRGSRPRRLAHQASRVRPVEDVPDRGVRVRRARRHDGYRQLGRQQPRAPRRPGG